MIGWIDDYIAGLNDDIEQIVSAVGRQSACRVHSWILGEESVHMMEIVSSLMRQLSWTHLIYIIALDDPLKREFYAEMCRVEQWSTRTLQKKIGGMLFERTATRLKPCLYISPVLFAPPFRLFLQLPPVPEVSASEEGPVWSPYPMSEMSADD